MSFVRKLLQTSCICFNSKRHTASRNILNLRNRGIIDDIFPQDSTKAIADVLNKAPQYVYAGFDPTAESLHIGNLLILIKLLHWQRAGHHAIALIGGATGRIGDPSGRNTERPLLEDLNVDKNLQGIESNIVKIFENHEKYIWKESIPLNPIIIENNISWYEKMNSIDFVGKIGRHFRMGTMLLKQSVKSRMESDLGLSFTEFTYQIFQAYDWLHLLQKHNCKFQIGGSDQMGNIVAGHELISRVSKKQVYGITLPIITNEEGDKFGKSAGKAIWLDETKTSPHGLYQFFIRSKDSEVEQLLKYFTFLTENQINQEMIKHNEEPEKRHAQNTLAEQVTLLVHGEKGLERALRSTKVLYGKNIESLLKLSATEIVQIFEDATIVSLLLEPGMSVLDLAMKAKCFPTENDAMRIIDAGGFHINHQKCKNYNEVLSESFHIMPNKITLLRVGKRNYHIVKWL